MSKEFDVKYWKDEGHILVNYDNSDCFILNEYLNPLVNWLNLNRQEIATKGCVYGGNTNRGILYVAVNGMLMIRTNRDVVFLGYDQTLLLIKWLNEHKEILKIHEVWP